MSDTEILRQAAVILRERSKRPNAFGMRVLCTMLDNVADKISREIAET